MVVGFENCIGKGFVCIAIIVDNDIVFQHRKFITHELEIGVDLVQVAMSANEQVFVALDNITTLLKHRSQHVEGTVQKILVVIPRKLKETENDSGSRVILGMLEEIPVFVSLFNLLLILVRDHCSDFVVPEVFFQHHILILTVFLHFSQDVRSKYFVEFVFCTLIANHHLLTLLLS
jgi:hypothetical protein